MRSRYLHTFSRNRLPSWILPPLDASVRPFSHSPLPSHSFLIFLHSSPHLLSLPPRSIFAAESRNDMYNCDLGPLYLSRSSPPSVPMRSVNFRADKLDLVYFDIVYTWHLALSPLLLLHRRRHIRVPLPIQTNPQRLLQIPPLQNLPFG